MRTRRSHALLIGIGASILAALSVAATTTGAGEPPAPPWFTWTTVVNNGDQMPPLTKLQQLQPAVGERERAGGHPGAQQGGPPFGPPTHGIYTRDMVGPGSPIVRILDRKAPVPQPNNLATKFVETPSFPRIDMLSDTIATRGNHQPVWEYTVDEVKPGPGPRGSTPTRSVR